MNIHIHSHQQLGRINIFKVYTCQDFLCLTFNNKINPKKRLKITINLITINFWDIFPGSYSDKSTQSASPKIHLFVAGYMDFFDTQTIEWFGLEI